MSSKKTMMNVKLDVELNAEEETEPCQNQTTNKINVSRENPFLQLHPLQIVLRPGYQQEIQNLRRAKSCKNNSRDGSSMGRQTGSTSSLNKKPLSDTKRTAYTKNEVTFGVRKAMYGRRGWMVMPLEDTIDLKAFKPEVMDTVTSKIRTMELSGITVPNEIKIRLSEC